MLEITPFTHRCADACLRAYRARVAQRDATAQPPTSPADPGDRVELSTTGVGDKAEASSALDERIKELRERIANGTYLTPDKIDCVVECLRARIAAESVDAA